MTRALALVALLLGLVTVALAQTGYIELGNNGATSNACPTAGACSDTVAVNTNNRQIATTAFVVSNLRPQVSAQRSSNQGPLTSGSATVIIWNLADIDTASGLNTGTGVYTPGVTGTYVFCTTVTFTGDFTLAAANANVRMLKTGTVFAVTRDSYPTLVGLQAAKTLCRMVAMGNTDTLSIDITLAGANLNVLGATTGISSFYGVRIGP